LSDIIGIMKTLEDILLDINAFIDLDASLPTGT